ncbi:MAG TPA: S1 RNA-binding domain-containing protein [Phycisphaerae bacterium]|nr:S1 RNA-binding domain-containing protein [Phycisphaerae bacterium]
MTTDGQDADSVPKFRRPDNLDAELQREIDEALGDASLEEMIEAEERGRSSAAGARAGAAEGVRRGRVVAIQGDDIFVELGGKDQGVLPASQFADEPLPAEGDEVEFTVEGYDESEGLLTLSRLGAIQAAAWETLAEGQVVEARVTGHNKGGLEVSIDGIDGFMPISQIELFRVEELKGYVDQRLRCQVTDIDRSEQNVIVSRRALLEQEAAEARERAWESVAEGQLLAGTVKKIMPYGAFVDIGGIDGLLHVADMSHSRVEDPKAVVHEGQQLQVKVLKVDRETRRISLGLKQVLPDPWDEVAARYAVDDVVAGRVTRLMDFGAFVELEPGIEGLVPISELSFTQRVGHPRESLSEGQPVKLRVLNVDTERRRIALSLKRVGDDPWVGASVRWAKDAIVEGVITRLTDFGAFVELTAGVDGLVHISELSDGRVRAASDVVQEGQTIAVKVLSVDEDQRRISLSIKQALASPEYAGPAEPDEEPPPPRKRKKPLKGGLE